MRHLTPDNYRTMPWANGRGVTVEMLRVDQGGALKWRLSRASVVEEGDFSIFPAIERNLTVISGPGFDLIGPSGRLRARPLVPVAFAGDLAFRAVAVTAPSDDFNVMTARGLPCPQVQVVNKPTELDPGGTVAVFALNQVMIGQACLNKYELILADHALTIGIGGPVIVVRFFD